MSYKNQLQELLQKKGLPFPNYEPLSSIGPPHQMRVSVTWEGQELSEEGEANNKREAGKIAAEKMYKRLLSLSGAAPQDTDTRFSGVSGSPNSHKSTLQELLQKHGYLVPTYEELGSRGAAHKKEFTMVCRLTVHDGVLEQQGSGSNKKSAENDAATNMLKVVRLIIELGGTLSASSLPRRRQTPPPEVIDQDLDGDIGLRLASYGPRFDCQLGEGGVVLCLARATSGCGSLPAAVAAQGQGESESQAKREAALNLAHNLQDLNFKLS